MQCLFLDLSLNPLNLFSDKSPRNNLTENFKYSVIDYCFKISIATRVANKNEVLQTVGLFAFKLLCRFDFFSNDFQ